MGCGASAPPKDDIAPYLRSPAPADEPPLVAMKTTSPNAASPNKKVMPKPKGGSSAVSGPIAHRLEANGDAKAGLSLSLSVSLSLSLSFSVCVCASLLPPSLAHLRA